MLRKSAIFKLLLVFIIPLLLSACENSTETNPPPDSTNTFPNKVGDQWIYSVYDSLSHSVDTLTISIVGTTTGNGKDFTIWTRKSNFYNDTIYVNVDQNTVYYYNDPYSNVVDHKIEFPLEVGKYWTNPDQVADSSIVKNKESVIVPADTYSDAYRIERDWGSFNAHGHSITWFVDNVGIVKIYQSIQSFKETWELLSYTENNPPPTNTFPNKVGDRWVYSVYDSLSHSVDTLTISIVGTTTSDGKNLTIWTRKSNFYNDTMYVYVDRNTVYYYNDPYPIVADHKIEFPLEVGNSWINTDQVSDSSIVKNKESVTVPADTYSGAYRIERDWGSFNVYGHSVTWFVDNIGIVKLYQRIQGFDNIKETWELLSYTVL